MKFGNLINSFALAVRADGTYTPFSSDAWSYAGQMTLLGMGMIFIVLSLLMLVLYCFKLVFARTSPKKLKAKKVKKLTGDEEIVPISSAATSESVSSEEIVSGYRDESEEELIAVITAAVAAYREAEGIDKEQGFRVVSFKRTGNRAWNTRN